MAEEPERLDEDVEPAPAEQRAQTRRYTRLSLIVFGAAAGVMLLGVLIVHGRAYSLYQAAGDTSLSLDARAAAARESVQLESFMKQYRIRFGYLYAQRLARDGHLAQAVDVMAATYKLAVGDAELLAYFKKLQDELAQDSNRKAHLQHGHEGPGGTLRPEDIER